MASSEHLACGDRAFVDEDYEAALAYYGKEIQENPSAVAYEARANAHIKLEKHVEAAEDASKAIALDPSNAKAYLRKG